MAAEAANRRLDNGGYDPSTYVEADFFGEEDTRSNLMRLVSGRLTKIINIPNMKDHGATGVTGCLKNIAYGSFSNVARTHSRGVSHTLSFVGTLAAVEPLRSRTVLQIMDGLRGVWHGGPFARTRRYVFYPRQILFGTDPVAIDRLLLDVIDDKRKAEGAISIWDRSPSSLKTNDERGARPRPEREHPHSRAGARGVRGRARPRGLRPRTDRRARDLGVSLFALLAALPALYWTGPVETAPALRDAGIEQIRVPPESLEAWTKAAFRATALRAAERSAREKLPAPGIQGQGRSPPPPAPRGSSRMAGGSCASPKASTPTRCPRGAPPWPRPRPSPTAPTPCSRSSPRTWAISDA